MMSLNLIAALSFKAEVNWAVMSWVLIFQPPKIVKRTPDTREEDILICVRCNGKMTCWINMERRFRITSDNHMGKPGSG